MLTLAALFFAAMTQTRSGLAEDSSWIDATDTSRVKQIGDWRKSSFRYAHASHLQTSSPDAALEIAFEGTGIAIRLANNAVPAYGRPNLGRLVASVVGSEAVSIEPQSAPLEFVVARNLPAGKHTLRVEHLQRESGSGCRVEGFHVLSKPTGELDFALNGEADAFLVESRAILRREGRTVRNTLVRNWLTGACRLAAIPPGKGYSLELITAGWQTVTVPDIEITAGAATSLPAIYLSRTEETKYSNFRFPALNQVAVRKPGQSFRARFNGYRADIDKVTLRRVVGPATISKELKFEEDKDAAFYYDREVIAQLPEDMPAGLYDLIVTNSYSGRPSTRRSPRSVHIVESFPKDPVLVTFGHLDTSSQYQAEYLERLATMANLIGPDFVLNSNAVNPAYISGALTRLDVPYMVNFGNHRFHGHEKWYGDQVGMMDFGPHISVVNFGHAWHADRSKAEALLASRKSAACKIINSYENNAPLDFLDRHGIRMIHDAHGTGPRVMDMGKTPTVRVGKMSAVSFRVVRFEDSHIASCTYNGHEVNPIPFGREEIPPLRSVITPANDGTSSSPTATVTNDYLDAFPNARVTFVVPRGRYVVDGGRIESNITSDDARFSVVTVRLDVPAESTAKAQLSRK